MPGWGGGWGGVHKWRVGSFDGLAAVCRGSDSVVGRHALAGVWPCAEDPTRSAAPNRNAWCCWPQARPPPAQAGKGAAAAPLIREARLQSRKGVGYVKMSQATQLRKRRQQRAAPAAAAEREHLRPPLGVGRVDDARGGKEDVGGGEDAAGRTGMEGRVRNSG